jgi:hypothetical protein
MKIFGYAKKQASLPGLLEMSEVSFVGSPEQIRAVARFLTDSADKMEQSQSFGHSHFQDECPEWQEEWPDVIVAS